MPLKYTTDIRTNQLQSIGGISTIYNIGPACAANNKASGHVPHLNSVQSEQHIEVYKSPLCIL